MKLRVVILPFSFLCWFSFSSYSQSQSATHKVNIEIPEVALLGLVSESSQHVNLYGSSPPEAGDIIDFSDLGRDKIWINYSSVIPGPSQKRKVTARLQDELPGGVNLIVEASPYQGSGKGTHGTPAGGVTLSDQPADIIVGIGSCYTGKGINNGHFLSYRLETDAEDGMYALLSRQQTSVNVIYTITE